MQLKGLVVGEQDLPPASPHPTGLQLDETAGTEVEAGAAADGESAEGGAAEAHPLLAMPEEERLLHLQAQASPHMCLVA